MHIEILVEDLTGKKLLKQLVPKFIGDKHSIRVFSFKGIGRIPKDLMGQPDPGKRTLLDNLPKLLKGYSDTLRDTPAECPDAIFVICDLDNKCLKAFRKELLNILNACNPKPEARFCIAIEEGEAWLLGDMSAIKKAYPKAKDSVLNGYVNDSICGTWEKLADAVYNGGAQRLASQGYQAVGAEKSAWAERIPLFMDVENNGSPSFCYFRQKLRDLAK